MQMAKKKSRKLSLHDLVQEFFKERQEALEEEKRRQEESDEWERENGEYELFVERGMAVQEELDDWEMEDYREVESYLDEGDFSDDEDCYEEPPLMWDDADDFVLALTSFPFRRVESVRAHYERLWAACGYI